MKTERVAYMLTVLANLLDDEGRKNYELYLRAMQKDHLNNFVNACGFDIHSIPYAIASMMCECNIELARECEKTSGTSKQTKVIKHVIKYINSAVKPAVSYIVPDRGQDKQIVCDGKRVFLFTDICWSVPIATETEYTLGKPETFLKFIYEYSEFRSTELEIPSSPQLVAYLKQKKAYFKVTKDKYDYSKVVYNFGPGLPAVSVEFLIDAIDAAPDAKCYTVDNGHTPVPFLPLLFIGERTISLLMPVRKNPAMPDHKTIL